MKNTFKYNNLIFVAFCLVMAAVSCNTDPEYYTDVVPDTFFTSQDAVWQRYCRPFTHWKWFVGTDRNRFDLMELGTDEICCPTRGSDWYNGGLQQNQHHHIFETSPTVYYKGFYGVGMGIALAWDTINDLEQRVDFEKVGLTQKDKELMVAQLNILVANLYKDGLDMFGGLPLYGKNDKELLPRSTDVQTFEFIEKLIKDNIDKIPLKEELGAEETTYIHRAWAAMNLAELYFNAEVYTSGQKSMYSECAKICQDIIDGVYGKYELGKSYQQIFGYGNEKCPEMIYGIPSDATYSGVDGGFFATWFHYNTNKYLGGTSYGKNNGFGIQPSFKPDGTPYTDSDFKLGRVMAKFEDTDLRKQPYKYEAKGAYTGMFLMGRQSSPSTNYGKAGLTKWESVGAREYKNKVVYLSDRVARYSKDAGVTDWNSDGQPLDANGKVMALDRFSSLPSNIASAEEASCYRLIKICPPVDKLEYDDLRMRFPAMKPISRLTEAYYMLAECKMRAKDKDGAAKLINAVRKRYFVDGKDPDPVSVANLDEYRMLDEWMIEFLGEARRRTDLIRWDAFVTEPWWDHTPSNNKNFNRYPIPDNSIAGNNLLEQNPGY